MMHWILPEFVAILSFVSLAYGSRADRPRGVPLTKKVFYDPDKDFTCLDGSRTISFSHVNDDYCDCIDGSDEPGTSACPNGQFHCANSGFKTRNIPSSRVNDGICDCCDGSDEWKNEGQCLDTCKELWKSAREDLQRQAEVASRGVAIKKEYSDRGIKIKAENEQKLQLLKADVEEIKRIEEESSVEKEQAEKAEKEAKDREQLAWNDFKEKVQQQQESRQAADAFTELDANKDGSISLDELQIHAELDSNPDDGEFTADEARMILGGELVEAQHFIEVSWKEISGKFISIPVVEAHDSETAELSDLDEDDPEENDDDLDEDDLDDEEEDGEYENDLDEDSEHERLRSQEDLVETENIQSSKDESSTNIETPKANLPPEPVWSDATKLLIAAADQARQDYEDHRTKKSDMERDILSLEKKIGMDFGPDEAYQELHGNCYDLDTPEYTYKLCPFDKAVQKPKSGGSETSLGRWGSWNGQQDEKYSSMKYVNGLRCWNGPDRSAEVRISCGDENKLLSVTEPSRCEYRFEFATPAACGIVHVPDQPHDEL